LRKLKDITPPTLSSYEHFQSNELTNRIESTIFCPSAISAADCEYIVVTGVIDSPENKRGDKNGSATRKTMKDVRETYFKNLLMGILIPKFMINPIKGTKTR
jgi:hypothetical protein